jgi:glutamate:GABA antiporter
MYQPKELKLFTLVMINLTAVLSLSSIAYMATIGLQSIFFFAVAAIMFFIPSALVSAELGGMMTDDNGGVYTWVSRAFGKNIGLVAIWMEWFNNVIGFPATMAAMVATFAYVGFPSLASNSTSMFLLMLIVMWGITLFNCLPIGKVTILNVIGGLFGMILPGVLLIGSAIYWFTSGSVVNVHFSNSTEWVPTISFATFALFVKVLSSYSGIQAVSFHAKNIKRPAFNIPLSMLITVVIIFCLTTFATVSLASIVPNSELNALNGLIQGISVVLQKLELSYLAPYISMCICIGMLAALSTWVLSPARGMQVVASQGLIPSVFAKTNKAGMPVAVLFTQAVIGSVLATVFLYMPTIEAAFAMIIALTSQFTVIMFSLIFLSAIRLRYIEPDTPRSFRVGKSGNFVLIFCAGLGVIACCCGFFLGLFPPKFSHVQNVGEYVTLMLIADAIIISIPFIYILYKKLK